MGGGGGEYEDTPTVHILQIASLRVRSDSKAIKNTYNKQILVITMKQILIITVTKCNQKLLTIHFSEH